MSKKSESTPNKVTLIEQSGKVTRSLIAEILANGDLQVTGVDSSDDLKQIFGEGVGEYEYFITVTKEHKDRLLLAMLASVHQPSGKNFGDLQTWLEKKGIPHKFSNWFSRP